MSCLIACMMLISIQASYLSLKSWWVPQALEYQPSITEIMMGTTSSGISTLYHWNHDGYHKLWNINPLSLKSWWVPQALEYQPSITEIMIGTTSSGISTLYHWNHDGYHKLWNINPLSLKSWWVPQALEYQPSVTVIMMGTTSSGISTLRVSHLLLVFCVVLLRVITFWCPLRCQHKNDVRFVFTSNCL